MKKNNTNENLNRNDSNLTDLVKHTKYIQGRWYDFKLSKKDTIRFSSALQLLDNPELLINLILELTKDGKSSSLEENGPSEYSLQALNALFYYLRTQRYNTDQFLSQPVKLMKDAMYSFTPIVNPNEFYDSSKAPLEDVIVAFEEIMMVYLTNDSFYNSKLVYEGFGDE